MLTKNYKIFLAIFISFFLANFTIAQSFLTHNTTNIQVAVFENGNIGHLAATATGTGVTFGGGPDAWYSGGFIMGNSTTLISGQLGSFSINADLVNTTPISAFSSDANFNQIATATFNDNGAPSANQLGLTVTQRSLSNTGDAFIIIEYTLVNNSGSDKNGVYAGIFSDWDVGVNNYDLNRGGYDQSRGLAYQYENGGAIDSRYYGIVALSGLGGARVTADGTTATIRDSSFAWISTFMNEPILANGDYRMWIGSGPYNIPNGTLVRVSFAIVAGADLAALEANTDLAQTKYDNFVVPVELTSFAAASLNGQVKLEWATATETNNLMFEIERKSSEGDFVRIGYVNGAGTTTEGQQYSYLDSKVTPGHYFYRLKQIDFNGQFEYSDVVEVDVTAPIDFNLAQNFPNPFNPITKIQYSIAEAGLVKLSIYNLLGQEVKVLVNEFKEAGAFDVQFDASNIPSGAYLYKLEANNFTQMKKMILMK
jgi:hypothetical protein